MAFLSFKIGDTGVFEQRRAELQAGAERAREAQKAASDAVDRLRAERHGRVLRLTAELVERHRDRLGRAEELRRAPLTIGGPQLEEAQAELEAAQAALERLESQAREAETALADLTSQEQAAFAAGKPVAEVSQIVTKRLHTAAALDGLKKTGLPAARQRIGRARQALLEPQADVCAAKVQALQAQANELNRRAMDLVAEALAVRAEAAAVLSLAGRYAALHDSAAERLGRQRLGGFGDGNLAQRWWAQAFEKGWRQANVADGLRAWANCTAEWLVDRGA